MMRLIYSTLPFLLLCFLGGCMVGPPYQPPMPLPQTPPAVYKESPSNFSETGGWKIAQPQDAMLRGKWWEIFHDPQLNALEDQLDINNQNIKVYFQNFMEARALIAEARSQLYPTVTVSPAYTRSRSPSIGVSSAAFASGNGNNGIVASSSGNQTTFVTLPFDVSWEPDLWGKVRYAINEETYNSQLSAADLENERLTEEASLATYFFEIRGQDALQQLYNNTVAADKKSLDYAQSQYQTGIGDQISVIEAQTTLQSAQAAALDLGVARAQYEHAIAVLVGKNPSQFSIPVNPSVTSPPPIPIGVPSQLLERRPDIAAAERTMAAANAQIGIEYTAWYPQLTLSASAGFESNSIDSLLDWPNRFWSIGPSASYTIFDAGLRRATVDQYVATFNGDLATYRQTVLTAFQQVEDNLAAVRIQSLEVEQLETTVKSAQNYVKIEWSRYKTGIDPYVDFVTAETTLLADQQTLIS
ncbi:MAG TPA: efflux transporter outer membrane subunit, partial [Tepidisphaeraceae bacterium]|nr:efflux transporter outer membrane subunit [Tepidisphaeraceae bacterium]